MKTPKPLVIREAGKDASATELTDREPAAPAMVDLLLRPETPGNGARGFRKALRQAPLTERVSLEREGVPAEIVEGLIEEIGVTKVAFQKFVGIPKATFTKKMKARSRFGGTSGHAVLGLLDLINTVEDMFAAENGNPDAANFDAAAWVGKWITRTQPALGGAAPAALMDTPSGRKSSDPIGRRGAERRLSVRRWPIGTQGWAPRSM